jgi:hypothetical protein
MFQINAIGDEHSSLSRALLVSQQTPDQHVRQVFADGFPRRGIPSSQRYRVRREHRNVHGRPKGASYVFVPESVRDRRATESVRQRLDGGSHERLPFRDEAAHSAFFPLRHPEPLKGQANGVLHGRSNEVLDGRAKSALLLDKRHQLREAALHHAHFPRREHRFARAEVLIEGARAHACAPSHALRAEASNATVGDYFVDGALDGSYGELAASLSPAAIARVCGATTVSNSSHAGPARTTDSWNAPSLARRNVGTSSQGRNLRMPLGIHLGRKSNSANGATKTELGRATKPVLAS